MHIQQNTRMKSFLALSIFYLFCSSLHPQANSILKEKNTDELVNKQLQKALHKNYAERKKTLKIALQSVHNLQQYQQSCKQKYLGLLPSFSKSMKDSIPISCSSSYCIANTDWDFYIDKIILNKRITANVYLPKKEGKKPAILFFCGHEKAGKATESYQETAHLLAQNGFVVMVIDPVGQAERIQLIDSIGNALTTKATSEHTLLQIPAILTGGNIAEEQITDNYICMNYLSNLEEVDSTRIGCMGNSGGGAQATYYAALDKRIKAVVCCSWFTKRERMYALYGPDDGCQYLANEVREQLEIADYYIMQAPRPTLILAGTKDFIDYKGTQEAYKELEAAYKLVGKTNQLELFTAADGHGISLPKREAAVLFLKKQLMNDTLIVHKETSEILPEHVLNCTNSGQILIDYTSTITLQEKFIEKANSYSEQREQFKLNTLDANRILLKQLLSISDNKQAVRAKTISKNIEHNLHIEKTVILKRNNEPEIPIRLLTPKKGLATNFELFVILNDSGMQQTMQLPIVDKIISSGNIVVLADLRGIGESKDKAEKNNPKFYNDDYRNSSLALTIGKPMLGERVIEIIKLVDYIKQQEEYTNNSINCFGFGNIGVALQHAYFLDERIQHIALKDCISSWMDILHSPLEKNRMSLIIPEALLHYDLSSLKRNRTVY